MIESILCAVEPGKMLADNFFRHIAFGPLCAGVPVHYVSVLIEHVDGVIGDALHQQAKAHLLLPLFALLLLLPGAVAADRSKPNQLSGLVADRIDDHVCPEAAAIFTTAPAFVFVTSGGDGDIKFALRLTATAILFVVKQGGMLSNNFVWPVTKDVQTPAVPAGDRSVRFKHGNRVVDHALYQHAIHDIRVIIHCYLPAAR